MGSFENHEVTLVAGRGVGGGDDEGTDHFTGNSWCNLGLLGGGAVKAPGCHNFQTNLMSSERKL